MRGQLGLLPAVPHSCHTTHLPRLMCHFSPPVLATCLHLCSPKHCPVLPSALARSSSSSPLLSSLCSVFILRGDFNIHTNDTADTFSSWLFDFLDFTNLHLHNNQSIGSYPGSLLLPIRNLNLAHLFSYYT